MTVVVLRPNGTVTNTGALTGGATAHAVLSDDSDSSYVEFNVFGEQVTVNLGDITVPAGAVVSQLALRGRFASGGRIAYSRIIVGSSSLAAFPTVNWSTPTTITAVTWPATFTDAEVDSAEAQFLMSSGGGSVLQVYEAYLDVTYVAQPVVSVTAPTGTITDTNQPTIIWTNTLDSDGGAQTVFNVRVFTDAQYGAGGFDPATSTATVNKGAVGADTSWQVDTILADDTYRAYVRVAQTVNGTEHYSDWSYTQFVVSVALPAVPTLTLTPDNANGRIRVQAADNAGTATTDYLELQRSLDAGVTWESMTADYLTPDADIYDYEAPNGVAVYYRVRALHDYSGAYASSAWASDDATWSSDSWWLKCPAAPNLNMVVRVRSFKTVERPGRQGMLTPLGAATPVVVSDTRESTRGSVILRLDSTAEQSALDALLDPTTTLMLQSPPGGGGPDYIRILGHERERVVDWQDATPSFDTLNFVKVAAPNTAGTGATGQQASVPFNTAVDIAARMTAVEQHVAVLREALPSVADAAWDVRGDGSDETTKIAAAIANGPKFFPPGDYRVSSAISVPNFAHIEGLGQSTVLRPLGNHYVLNLNPANRSIVRNLQFSALSAQSSGGAIDFTNVANNVWISDIWFGDGLHTSLNIAPAAQGGIVMIDRIRWNGVTGCARGIVIGDGTNIVSDVYISHAIGTSATATDMNPWVTVNKGGADTLHMTDCLFYQGAKGLLMGFTGTTGDATNHKFVNVVFDNLDQVGVDIESCRGVDFANCAIQGAGTTSQAGLRLGPSVKAFTWTGGFIHECESDGVRIESGAAGVKIAGAKILNCNRTNQTFGAGITVQAGASTWEVMNCTIGNELPVTANQKYGILVGNGASNDLMVTGNRFPGNVTAAYLNSGVTGQSVIWRDNLPEVIPSIASAATVTLPPGPLITITGTTTITSITAAAVGRSVTLIFSGALTLTDGSNLKLNGNFVTTADDTITLVSDGTNWVETARSAN